MFSKDQSKNQQTRAVAQAGTDIAMGAIGTYTGPAGLITASLYYLGGLMGANEAADRAIEKTTYKLFNNMIK